MKYSISLKFIAIVLTACALVSIILCVIGITTLGQMNLYDTDLDSWLQRQYRNHTYSLAKNLGNRYASRTFSDAPQALLEEYAYNGDDESFSNRYNLEPDNWYYTIKDSAGNLLDTNLPTSPDSSFWEYSFNIAASYLATAKDPENYDIAYPLEENGEQVVYLQYQNADTYNVTVLLSRNAFSSYNGIPIFHIDTLYQSRFLFILWLAAGLLVFAAGVVVLCYISGKKCKTAPVEPGVFNRLPLDLYGVNAAALCALLVYMAQRILRTFFYYDYAYDIGGVTLSSVVLLVASIIAVGFLYAVAAQCKADGRYWWRHSLTCRLSLWVQKNAGALSASFRRRLPLVWRWLLLAVGIEILLGFSMFLAVWKRLYIPLILVSVAGLLLLLYCAWAYGGLLSGAKRMTRGDLKKKIATKGMLGSYGELAEDLNTLAEVVVQAAQKELRTERMKTELITNISHDIKTPLTSIINYVDLLEKETADQTRQEYLTILNKQSYRLKKLIDDLMEMSRASSGSIPVEITQLDAAETVCQALGEFSDKLASAGLVTVFLQPEAPVPVLADGKLAWRVLSNLLSNAVKYALPGTRVYVDLVQLESRVMLSIKNISREPLNLCAEELTERFVRGDRSRNTEGSGLGLNIAKSLMELQQGHLQVLVDGDLFKVTLVFRSPEAPQD